MSLDATITQELVEKKRIPKFRLFEQYVDKPIRVIHSNRLPNKFILIISTETNKIEASNILIKLSPYYKCIQLNIDNREDIAKDIEKHIINAEFILPIISDPISDKEKFYEWINPTIFDYFKMIIPIYVKTFIPLYKIDKQFQKFPWFHFNKIIIEGPYKLVKQIYIMHKLRYGDIDMNCNFMDKDDLKRLVESRFC